MNVQAEVPGVPDRRIANAIAQSPGRPGPAKTTPARPGLLCASWRAVGISGSQQNGPRVGRLCGVNPNLPVSPLIRHLDGIEELTCVSPGA